MRAQSPTHTTPLPTGDFAGRMDRAFADRGTPLRSVGPDFGDIARLRTHIVDHDPDKLTVVGTKIAEMRGDRPPVQTLTGVVGLALPTMLFEVDAVAVRPRSARRGRIGGWRMS